MFYFNVFLFACFFIWSQEYPANLDFYFTFACGLVVHSLRALVFFCIFCVTLWDPPVVMFSSVSVAILF